MATMSMTGFGRAQTEFDGVQLEVELRSVNHRFLDTVWRMPSGYSAFESGLQKVVSEKLNRGRVEVSVSRKDTRKQSYELSFNRDLYEAYLKTAEDAFSLCSEAPSVKDAALNFLQRREVLELVVQDADVEKEYSSLEGVLKSALEELMSMREAEGKTLEGELLGHLKDLEKLVKDVAKKAQSGPSQFQTRLTARLAKLSPEIEVDPMRLAQEVAVLADRTDVTEEIARLESHIGQFRKIIKDSGGGRKLEFLLQEMGREVNTTGSKAQDSDITVLVIEAKAILEKLREQVLNIE